MLLSHFYLFCVVLEMLDENVLFYVLQIAKILDVGAVLFKINDQYHIHGKTSKMRGATVRHFFKLIFLMVFGS